MRCSWIPRRFEPGDETKIDRLLRRCHGEGYAGMEYWSWVFKRNPLGFHGAAGDIWVAEANFGHLVGYYGRIRVPMWAEGKSVVGSQVAMVATHPDYRRQGIYDSLSRSATEDAARNGIAISFGFPNDFSYPAAVKHRWVDFGAVKDLSWVLDRTAFLARMRRSSMAKVVAAMLLRLAGPRLDGARPRGPYAPIEFIEGFLEDAGRVWDSLKHHYDLGIERTRAYLEWRYDRAWGEYQILSAVRGGDTVGYVVVRAASRSDPGRGDICELMSINDDLRVYRALLREVWRRGTERGMICVWASSSCSRGHDAALRGNRSRTLAVVMKSLRHVNGHLVAHFLQEEPRDRPRALRWYCSVGDRDFG